MTVTMPYGLASCISSICTDIKANRCPQTSRILYDLKPAVVCNAVELLVDLLCFLYDSLCPGVYRLFQLITGRVGGSWLRAS